MPLPGSDTISGPNTRLVAIAGFLVLMVLAFGVSSLVGMSEGLAIMVVLGMGIFLFAFLNTDFALIILILSMLLSPEFNVGSAGGQGQMSHRGVVVRIDDLMLGLIMFSWLIKTAVNKDLGIFRHSPLNRPIFLYIGASLFSTILGVFFGDVKPLIGILYNVKYFQYYLIYFMVISHVTDMETLRRYVKLIIVTAIIVSLYAMSQIPSGVRVSAPFEGEGGEANTLGGYLVLIMAVVMGMMTGQKRAKRLFQMAAAVFIMLIPFAYTLSRSSWMSLFPAIVGLIYYSEKRKTIIALCMVAMLFLPIIMPESVWNRVEYTFSPENQIRDDVVKVGDTSLDPSTSERIQSWSTTLAQWSERPFFGWGVTGVGFKDAQYFRVLAETGAIGFLFFFGLLISIHRTAKRSLDMVTYKKYPLYHGMIMGFIAGYWGLLLHAVGANTFIIVRVMEPFWFLLALVVALPELLEAEERKKRGDDELEEEQPIQPHQISFLTGRILNATPKQQKYVPTKKKD